VQENHHIFGRSITLGGKTALQLLENALAEGVVGMDPLPGAINIFGRSITTQSHPSLSFLQGISETGLRAAGMMKRGDLVSQMGSLQDISRQHLPLVLFGMPQPEVSTPALQGWIEWIAADPQEAVDLALGLHRLTERALVPGILWLDFDPEKEMEVEFPSVSEVVEFLGTPDDPIYCPTPAQELIFGPRRRRIPNWYNFDTPAYQAIKKATQPAVREQVARTRFFDIHLEEFITMELANLSQLTGRDYAPVSGYAHERAEHLIVASGETALRAVEAVDVLQLQRKARVGCLQLTARSPLPHQALEEYLSGKKTVTLLTPVQDAYAVTNNIKGIVSKWGRKAPQLLEGQYALAPSTDNLLLVWQNAMEGSNAQAQFVLGLDFVQNGQSPSHEVYMQELLRHYPSLPEESLNTPDSQSNTFEKRKAGLPQAIRQYQDQGPPYSQLSRFQHNTLSFYQHRLEETMPTDPYQALPQAPAASAGLAEQDLERLWIPVLRAEACTGCGTCMVTCPYAAIPSLALTPEELIRGVMDLSTQKGVSLSALTPLVKNLAKLAQQQLKKTQDPVRQASDFLPKAFERLMERMEWSGGKREEAVQAFEQFMHLLKDFPLMAPASITETTGALFHLSIDPNTCTGCALCVDACPEEALQMVDAEPSVIEKMEAQLAQWENLPDTSGPTIQQLEAAKELHPFAPQLLSRNFYHSMYGAGGDQQLEIRRLHHLITATAEASWQPRLAQEIRALNQLVNDLATHIHDQLSDSLPKDDFSSIAQALQDSKSPRLPLDELVDQLDPASHLELVDTEGLQRKIQLLEQLKELRQLISKGPTGVGRARYGLMLGKEVPYQFPFNPFVAPVIQVQHGQLSHLQGLMQGHLRHLLDNIRLIRRGYLEVNGDYRPEQHNRLIAELRWEQLTAEERRLAPPLLLIGQSTELSAEDLDQLFQLLESEYPVRVFLLSKPWSTPEQSVRTTNWTALLSGTKANVFQSSLEVPDQFFRSLRESLTDDRPALGLIDAGTLDGAVSSRSFPVFRYHPSAPHTFLAESLDLEGNPSIGTLWNGSNTLAHWLSQQPAWQEHFLPLPPDRKGTELTQYLPLPPQEREGIIPIIQTEEGETLAVSSRVLDACTQAQRQWTYLQTLAGTTTQHPEKLEQEVKQKMEIHYQEEIQRIREGYEQQLQQQKEQLMQEVKIQLKNKLVALAKKQQTKNKQ
jgi:ferredoxin